MEISTKTISTNLKTEVSENKLSYQEKKEQNRIIRKKEKELENIEKQIATFEKSLSEMETQLSTPERVSDMELLKTYLDTKHKLDGVMNNWEQLTLELEKLKD